MLADHQHDAFLSSILFESTWYWSSSSSIGESGKSRSPVPFSSSFGRTSEPGNSAAKSRRSPTASTGTTGLASSEALFSLLHPASISAGPRAPHSLPFVAFSKSYELCDRVLFRRIPDRLRRTQNQPPSRSSMTATATAAPIPALAPTPRPPFPDSKTAGAEAEACVEVEEGREVCEDCDASAGDGLPGGPGVGGVGVGAGVVELTSSSSSSSLSLRSFSVSVGSGTVGSVDVDIANITMIDVYIVRRLPECTLTVVQ